MKVYHIPSGDNFVSDLLTRWEYKEEHSKVRRTAGLITEDYFYESEDIYFYEDIPTISENEVKIWDIVQEVKEVYYKDVQEATKDKAFCLGRVAVSEQVSNSQDDV
eukprot:snap_masked-scaffold_2-processed-gene-18.30-mRNA-1 protein AED:1.00 eAED:1.00 QI:0/-1/0/0/-1/1/1/0/105